MVFSPVPALPRAAIIATPALNIAARLLELSSDAGVLAMPISKDASSGPLEPPMVESSLLALSDRAG